MKLSEAILLGSTMGPQAFCKWQTEIGLGGCALGAAAHAVGIRIIGHHSVCRFVAQWPFLQTYERCPVCPVGADLLHIVTHLNDQHEWTRERIAEFVAKIEPKEEVNGKLDKRQCAGAGGNSDQEGTGTAEATQSEAYAGLSS